MKLTDNDLKELESAMECLYNDGLNDGDLGYKHRVRQIELIMSLISLVKSNGIMKQRILDSQFKEKKAED